MLDEEIRVGRPLRAIDILLNGANEFAALREVSPSSISCLQKIQLSLKPLNDRINDFVDPGGYALRAPPGLFSELSTHI
jgi:hypothetical protein